MAEAAEVPDNLPYNEEELDIASLTPKIQWAYRYWRSKIVDGKLPGRDVLDPHELVAILPHVILLGVQREPLDFYYRLIGTEIDRHSEKYHTGQWMSGIPERRAPSKVWENCARVARSGQPSCRSIPYVGPHRDFISTCQVTLPLATDGGNVDMLFIAIDYVAAYGAPPLRRL